MRKCGKLVWAVVALSCVALPGRADTALSFTASTNHGLNGNYTCGWAFKVNTAITVYDLGVFDLGGDGLGGAHDVGLWAVGSLGERTLLASGTVAAGTAAALEGLFRYTAVTPVNLAPGTVYIVGALFKTNAGDYYTNVQTGLTFDSDIVHQAGSPNAVSYTSGDALAAPAAWDGYIYADANFRFGPVVSTVPEASSMALLLVGLAPFGAWARMRRKPGSR